MARSFAQPTRLAPRRVLDWDLGPQRVSGMRFEQSMGHQDRLKLSQGMRMLGPGASAQITSKPPSWANFGSRDGHQLNAYA